MSALTLIIGIIVGGIVVHKFNKLRRSIEERGGFTITIRGGYELRLSKKRLPAAMAPAPIMPVTAAVIPPPPAAATTSKKKLEQQSSDCKFCRGEPITIAGSKDTMPCPECKKKSTA